MENIENDKLLLEGRKKLSISNVENVDSYSEKELKIMVKGSKLLIIGENLKIEAYNKQTGNLIVNGLINELKFNVKKQPLIKKIFK